MKPVLRLSTALSIVLVSAVASADVTSRDALAESLFQDAKKLLAAGDVSAACVKFKASLDVDRASGTLTALAYCHQREGRTASAWAEYVEVANEAKRSGKADQEKFARAQIAALAPVLRKVSIRVTEAPGLELSLDGASLPASARDSAFPVDPGLRTIIASAHGFTTVTRKVTLEPGPGTTTVEITLAPTPIEDHPPHAAPAATPAPAPPRDRRALVLGAVGAGLGMAGIGAGLYLRLGVAARQQENAVFLARVAADDAGARREHERAETTAAIGMGVAAAGALLSIGGAWFLVRGLARPRASAALVVPWASATGAGIATAFEL